MIKNKRITIADIAQKSGYSKTAVSFAFNCPERISKEAVERILTIAKEMDYIPDPMARNFSLGRHLSIGFLVPQVFSVAFDNPHSVDVLKGIGTIAESFDYTVTLIPPLHSSIAEAIKSATVDGIIAMGLEFGPDVQEALKRRKLPFVCIDGIETEGIISVSIDDVQAAESQMMEVLNAGHRKVGIISLSDAAYTENDGEDFAPGVASARGEGYRKAYRVMGLEPDFVHVRGDATFDGGKEAAFTILKETKPTCLVCMSDVQAAGAMEACRELGIAVPNEISIVGFDGIQLNTPGGLALSTIEQKGSDKGKKAAEILFGMLKGEEPEVERNLVPFRFIKGETLKNV